MEIELHEWIKEHKESRLYEGGLSCPVLTGERHGNDTIVCREAFFFTLVTDGRGEVTVKEETAPLRIGDLLILSPSVEGRFGGFSPDFRMSCVYFEPTFFDCLSTGLHVYSQIAGFVSGRSVPLFPLEGEDYDYLKRVALLFEAHLRTYRLHREGIVRNLCNFYLLQIADILHRNNPNASARIKRANEIYRDFRRLLLANYREAHGIAFYADRLFITPTYLSRVVKRITGQTVLQHVAGLLCADARKLLACTDMEVKEIADRLGFPDLSSFGKFFKKETGLSPSLFRKRQGR